jgi:hypothetical protein
MAKKVAKRAGRPPLPKGERLDEAVRVRFRPDELELIGRVVTEGERAKFIRDAAVAEARRRLGE